MPELYQHEYLNHDDVIKRISLYEYTIEKQTRPHAHEYMEIGFVLKGSYQYHAGHDSFMLNEGDAMITAPGIVHQERKNKDAYTDVLYVCINPKQLPSPALAMIERSQTSAPIRACMTTEMVQTIRNMLIESMFQRSGYEQMMTHYASVIVILLSRFAIHRESNPNMAGNILELLLARNDLMIQQIKHAIETNPDPAQKTVKTIADRFYISSKQVNSMFKQATGYSIKQYDIHHRMNLAKTLLQHSDQSIQDIADTLHFSTIHYFHRLFKKVTSLTPTQYRLQQQSSGSTTHHSLR